MTEGTSNIELIIHQYALKFAEDMPKIAKWANSEEDIRHEFNKLIDEFLERADISIKGRHEYGLAGGRIDSKYGGVIIEYKSPKEGTKIKQSRNSPGTKALITQIEKRFLDFE